MKPEKKTKFAATILQNEGMDAGYIIFPYSTEELYGIKGRVKVKALFDDKVSYRGSLAKMGTDCHILGITKEIRKKLSKTFGDEINVEIEEDLEERTIHLPQEVANLLDKNPQAKAFYEGLSFTNKKEYVNWIASAKKEETRLKRLETMINKLENHQKLSDK